MEPFANGLSLFLLVAGIALLSVAFVRARRMEYSIALLYRRLISVESPERQRQFEFMEADNRRKLLQESVEGGTSAVEVFHRVVTTTTFEAIDRLTKSERVRENSTRAREIHDDTSRNVYRSIRIANRQVHALADVIIRMNRKRQDRNRKD